LADDYGNGRAGPVYLSSRVFPASESLETLKDALEELVRIRYVILYVVDGQRYFHIRNWGKHQKVNHPGKPLVPEFTAETKEASRDSQETLSPDRDRDRDRDQRPTTTTGSVVVTPPERTDPNAKVRCPAPLPIDEPTLVGLELDVGLPRAVAEAFFRDWARQQAAAPNDLRTVDAWVKCAVKAARGEWSRDKAAMRAGAGGEAAQDPEVRARREREQKLEQARQEKLARKTTEARAELAKRAAPPPGPVAVGKLVRGIGE
jgi:hypothetical protein